jgi:FlaA1/EpsC-like NDP-sugar epimerase
LNSTPGEQESGKVNFNGNLGSAVMVMRALTEQVEQLKRRSRNANFWGVLFVDVVLLVFAHVLAYFIRYEGKLVIPYKQIIFVLPLLLIIKIPIFYVFNLYRGMWRYTSINDLINITKATIISSFSLVLIILYATHFSNFSRSVFVMDGVFTFLFISMHRGAIRYIFENIGLLRQITSHNDRI